jgi:hypothetical protein
MVIINVNSVLGLSHNVVMGGNLSLALKMEEACTLETLVTFPRTT